jgi:hypothetical protein
MTMDSRGKASVETTRRAPALLAGLAEFGVALFVLAMLFERGEGVRNLGLYGALAAWLVLAVGYRAVHLPRGIVGMAFAGFAAAVLCTTPFSLDPLYSLTEFKDDYLIGAILFLVVSTVFDGRRLLRLCLVLAVVGAILFGLGIYSYLSGGSGAYFTSENVILSANKNRYGLFVGYVFPFFLVFAADRARGWAARLPAAAGGMLMVTATVLSGSRGALGNVGMAAVVWICSALKRVRTRYVIGAVAFFLVAMLFPLLILPDEALDHVTSLRDVGTFNERVGRMWLPALESVSERPLVGWGHGSRILWDPRPFAANEHMPELIGGGLHNTYISVLFEHGLIGLAAYALLVLSGVVVSVRVVARGAGRLDLVATAVLASLLGTFIVQAAVKLIAFRYLALVLAMAAAAARASEEKKAP